MGLRTFINTGLVRHTYDKNDLDFNPQNVVTNTYLPRSRSKRIASGLRKAFSIHHHHESGIESATKSRCSVEPPVSSGSQLYRLELSKQHVDESTDNRVEASRIEAKTTVKSGPSPLSTATYNTLTSKSSSVSANETLPTTASFEASGPGGTENSFLRSHEVDEHETTLAGLEQAKKLLDQRHAVMEKQLSNATQNIRPLGAIVRKTSPKSNTRCSLPPHIALAYRRQQPLTAQEACEALQRRQLIKNLAYNGTYDSDDAILILQQLKFHLTLKARHPATPDLLLNFSGVQIFATQLGFVERRWISRFFAFRKTAHLVARRAMSAEDCDTIAAQLFPDERQQLLKPEYFDIFMTGLGEEGIFPLQEAQRIARLGVSFEEFDTGARYTGPVYDDRYNASNLAIFRIPSPSPCPSSHSLSSLPIHYTTLYPHLRILVEATVYSQRFWKAHFFPTPLPYLLSFHTTHRLTSLGHPLPARLMPFTRPWCPRAVRLLARASLLCDLLSRHEAGLIRDFGIVRAVRAALVHVPGQPVYSREELEAMLWNRVAGSGVQGREVEAIVGLHPGYDEVCVDEEVWAGVLRRLREKTEIWEREERERESAKESAVQEFEAQRWAGMGRWERLRGKWRDRRAREEVVTRFDPFAVEGGSGSSNGSL